MTLVCQSDDQIQRLARGGAVRLAYFRELRKAVGGFVHFSRRWPTDCVADGAPMHTGRVRGCQPTGRAAGEYWHLFSHRYLLSSAKHGPTLSHYHERHRHTGHGIENSTVLCSLPFLPPSLWPPPPTCPRKATVRIYGRLTIRGGGEEGGGRAFDTHRATF